MMIARKAQQLVERALSRQAAVAVIGPRQVGKTTLAHVIADTRNSIYLDLEKAADRSKLMDPAAFLSRHESDLVILDEIHRMPEIFRDMRGLIDEGRRKGNRTGRFLILGSAAIELLRQSSETLAGRIEYVDLGPLNILELPDLDDVNPLWVRGGFPESYLAADDDDSFSLRSNFIRTYLERDVPMFGPRVPAETMERLWTMLAHNQAGLLNASRLASSLGVSPPTVSNYIGLLVDLLLVRRLQPFHANIGKRQIKSPKVYIRDSGITHVLLRIASFDELLGHPVAGASWEGFAIENLLAYLPERTRASYYRTSGGAEIDLVLELGGNKGLWAIEIKRSTAPSLRRGFYSAINDLRPSKSFVVYPGTDRYPISEDVEVISLAALVTELQTAR